MTPRPARVLPALLAAALSAAAWAQNDPQPANPAGPSPATPGQPAPSAGGRLSLEKTVLDWGVVTDQDALKAEVKFTNKGDSNLIFYEIKPSCGCVRPKLRGDKKSFAPGESGVIDVEFEPLNKQGPVKDLSISIRSNDEQQPSQRIDVKCDVKPTVGIDAPDGLSLGNIEFGATKSLTFYIFGRLPDFKATFATVSAESGFTVKVGPAEDGEFRGDKVRRSPVTITAEKNAKVGRFSHSVVIRHTDKRIRNGLWELPIAGEVLSDLRSSPLELDLGTVAMTSEYSALVQVSHAKGAPFKVISTKYQPVKGGGLEFTPEVTAGDKPEVQVIRVSGKAPARPGPLEGFIVVTTDIKTLPPVRIPVRMNVRLPQEPGAGGN